MAIVIGILTGILILTCIFLILIILMQKSKQEAGLGAAFGGAATEQLFGAGTTSVLTKATIWGTSLFFILTLILAMWYSHQHAKKGSIASKVLSTVATNGVPELVAAPGTNTPKATMVSTNTPPASAATNALAPEAEAASTNSPK